MVAKRKQRTGGERERPPAPTRTKIVATLGPASSEPETIGALVDAGVDVFRLNFSHGERAEHGRSIRAVRSAARERGAPVAVLADLQGPKIRVGPLAEGKPFFVEPGERLAVDCAAGVVGEPGRIGCSYRRLADDVRPGERLLLDDGQLELEVQEVEGRTVHTRVHVGGLLRPFKGINLPGTRVRAPSLSRKDLADLGFALEHGVDLVGLSFVRSADDVIKLRRRIRRAGSEAEVVAKIERPEAVEHLEAILEVSDAVMVARGDMGVELGPEEVPAIQKRIIALAIEAARPVITATQMLESMVQNPRPTRAEVSDVANAIHDGSSAVMLSGETAMGRYPVRAVETMERIARRTEAGLRWGRRSGERGSRSTAEATVRAAALAAVECDAAAIAVLTESGHTAKLMARERPAARLVGLTPSAHTYSLMALTWGVIPMRIGRIKRARALHLAAERALLEGGHVRPGDHIVLVAGELQARGAANAVLVREVGAG